jgi:hypothetical protein
MITLGLPGLSTRYLADCTKFSGRILSKRLPYANVPIVLPSLPKPTSSWSRSASSPANLLNPSGRNTTMSATLRSTWSKAIWRCTRWTLPCPVSCRLRA